MKLTHARIAALCCLALVAPASAAAPPGRYQVVDDQVVDTRTRLIWQRTYDARKYTWSQAVSYCAALNVAGQVGFRLPSRRELLSLVDYTVTDPAIDGVAFPDTPSDAFWTATAYAGSPTDKRWTVNFLEGTSTNDLLSSALYVRCVRATP